jgi:hypothetical protein
MSGGSWDYAYKTVESFANRLLAESREIDRELDPLRGEFAKHLLDVAKAMHDIEWVDSADKAAGDEREAILNAFQGSEVEAFGEEDTWFGSGWKCNRHGEVACPSCLIYALRESRDTRDAALATATSLQEALAEVQRRPAKVWVVHEHEDCEGSLITGAFSEKQIAHRLRRALQRGKTSKYDVVDVEEITLNEVPE